MEAVHQTVMLQRHAKKELVLTEYIIYMYLNGQCMKWFCATIQNTTCYNIKARHIYTTNSEAKDRKTVNSDI